MSKVPVGIFCVRSYGAFCRCDHLIQLGIEKGMQRAQIIPYGGNQLIDSSTRTNTAAWLNYHQDAVVARIENSIASFTKTHPLDGESLQILHYGNGQV
jgi:prolyl 4-hydroxylase